MPLFKRSTTAGKPGDKTRLRNIKTSKSLRNTDGYPSGKWNHDQLNGDFKDLQGSELLVSSSDDDKHPSNSDQKGIGVFHFSTAKGKDINTIAVVNSRAWIMYWNNNEVIMVNRDGETRKTVSLDVIITDISYSTATKELWMCCRDNSVREREPPESARVAFKTKHLPLSLCMLTNGTALVGMEYNITKYDLHGRILQAVDQLNLGGVPLIYPERIRSCPDTGRIAILDRSFVAWGGNGKPNISVLNTNLEFKFRYSSSDHIQQISLYRHNTADHSPTPDGAIFKLDDFSSDKLSSNNETFKKRNSSDVVFVNISSPRTTFNPRDMCFGPQGQIIIADYENKVVFSIDSFGEYRHQIVSCDVRPCALASNLNGKLWIGYKRQLVKILQLPS